jgi:class I fructose-bisphosphate aldolase
VKDEAVTATVRDALELGCAAIGYTIYPGSDRQYDMFEEVRAGAAEAKANGLAVVVWAYPRGGQLDSRAETALDVVAYGAHIAALLGAHIIKVKPPSAHIAESEASAVYAKGSYDQLPQRIAHVVEAAFNGRRIVIFSGGAARSDVEILKEVTQIHAGGGHGSIVGRNAFQRPRDEAISLLNAIIDIHLGRAS